MKWIKKKVKSFKRKRFLPKSAGQKNRGKLALYYAWAENPAQLYKVRFLFLARSIKQCEYLISRSKYSWYDFYKPKFVKLASGKPKMWLDINYD